MSIYISQENQTLLWEMIHKMPILNKVFSSQQEKENWFKLIIQTFYTNLNPTISREDLKQVNRDTLAAVMDDLRKRSEKMDANTMISTSYTPSFSENNSINIMNTNKENPMKNEKNPNNFENLKTQYNSLFEQQKPKEIDFKEKMEDDIITNMDELIEQHKRIREEELKKYTPEPIQELIDSKKVQFEEVQTIQQIQQVQQIQPDIYKRMDILEKKIEDLFIFLKEVFKKDKNENENEKLN